jgi:hypothetical protein
MKRALATATIAIICVLTLVAAQNAGDLWNGN